MTREDKEAFEAIISQIEGALVADLNIAALLVALTVPDICASLASEDGRSDGKRYAAWFDQNMPKYSEGLPGSEAYKMRCGFLHQARPTRPDMKWQTVGFSFNSPGQYLSQGNWVNGERVPDTLFVNTIRFCTDLVKAARDWLSAHEGDAVVSANIAKLLRRKERVDPMIGPLDALA